MSNDELADWISDWELRPEVQSAVRAWGNPRVWKKIKAAVDSGLKVVCVAAADDDEGGSPRRPAGALRVALAPYKACGFEVLGSSVSSPLGGDDMAEAVLAGTPEQFRKVVKAKVIAVIGESGETAKTCAKQTVERLLN